MRRPIIGITTDYIENRTRYQSQYHYASAVEKGGGLPLLIPHRIDFALIPQIVDALDGIVFSGGDDLSPESYGEKYVAGTEPIDPARETFERALIFEVEKRKLPALGICLGSQLMNLHRGGSLIQFLPGQDREDPIEHRRMGDWNRRHEVSLIPESTIAAHLQAERIRVNSSHKQSVSKVGKGLRIVATSPDGVIEGVEDPTFPLFLGVQWHPERMTDDPQQLALFQLLAEKARASQ